MNRYIEKIDISKFLIYRNSTLSIYRPISTCHSSSSRVYRHFGPRTLRTQDTSDLGHFGPWTLRVRKTLRHWCRNVRTLGHYFMNKCLANAKRSCNCHVLCLRLESSLCSCAHSISYMTSFGCRDRSTDTSNPGQFGPKTLRT